MLRQLRAAYFQTGCVDVHNHYLNNDLRNMECTPKTTWHAVVKGSEIQYSCGGGVFLRYPY